MTINKANIVYITLLISVGLSNVSQIPSLVENPVFKLLSYIPWLLLAMEVILFVDKKHTIRLNNSYNVLALVGGIMLICLVLEMMGRNGLNVYLLRPIMISIYIYIVSYNVAYWIPKKNFQTIALIYILSGGIVSVFVSITMLENGFSWDSGVYAYASKNSVSQILFTAWFLLILYRKVFRRIPVLLMDVGIGFLTVVLFMLKSRATLLCVIFVFCSVIFTKKYHITTRMLFGLLGIIFVFALINNINFRDLLLNKIIFAGRDSTDIDAISSGRVTMIEDFPEMFVAKPLLGYGQEYVECMQLDALIETGLIGGIIINILAVVPICYCIRNKRKIVDKCDFSLLIISLCYYANGFFEQLAPFGPGVKCYFLWMLYGMCLAWNRREETC